MSFLKQAKHSLSRANQLAKPAMRKAMQSLAMKDLNAIKGYGVDQTRTAKALAVGREYSNTGVLC